MFVPAVGWGRLVQGEPPKKVAARGFWCFVEIARRLCNPNRRRIEQKEVQKPARSKAQFPIPMGKTGPLAGSTELAELGS